MGSSEIGKIGCMDSLFKKLNTLVQATLHDVLREDERSGSSELSLKPAQLGKNIDHEIALLRQRINEALAFEDELQKRVQMLRTEVEKWDQQADEAVNLKDDTTARYSVEQMRRAQQRLVMAEADLSEHQKVTQELILRVNMLDAAVADARRENREAPESAPVVEISISPGQALADMLKNIRDKVEQVAAPSAPEDGDRLAEIPDQHIIDENTDDDLEKRRQRLAKK